MIRRSSDPYSGGIFGEESEMLTCIACSKQLKNGSMHRQDEEDPVSAAATPRTKQAIKTLSSQVFCLLPEKILDFQTLFLQICLGSCQCHPIIIQQKKKRENLSRIYFVFISFHHFSGGPRCRGFRILPLCTKYS